MIEDGTGRCQTNLWLARGSGPIFGAVRRLIWVVILGLAFLGAFALGRRAAPRVRAAPGVPPPETTSTAAAVAVLKDSLRASRQRLLRAIADRDTYVPA